MNESILVSIILPTYNRKNYIKRAIDSCLNQSHQNIEVIICDDHSTDKTEEYIYKLYKQNKRIFYYKTPSGHKGANAARNVGIQHAKGKYICFLDSDDELLENSIKDRLRVYEKQPQTGMVYGNAYCEHRKKWTLWIYNTMPLTKQEARKYLLEELSLCIQSTIMVRTDVFDKIGLLDERQNGWTDDGLVVAVGLRYPLVHCGTCVAVIHKIRTSMVSNKRNIYQGLKLLVERYKREIIREVSLRRYILWKIRILDALCYAKEMEEKFYIKKSLWRIIHHSLKSLIKPYFRNYFE